MIKSSGVDDVGSERMAERKSERGREAEERLKYAEKRWQVEETRSHLHIVCRMLRVYRTELPPFPARLLSQRALVPQIHPVRPPRAVVYARHETNA